MTEAKKTTTKPKADARSIYERVFAAKQNMDSLRRSTQGQVGSHKYMYVTLLDVMDACEGPLNDEGVLVSQAMALFEGGQILRTALINVSNPSDQMIAEMIMPALSDPQKMGSATTYYRKYSLKALLGLPDTDDDDGAAASGDNAGNATRPAEATFKPGVHEVVPTYVKKAKEAPDGSWTLFAIGCKDGEFTTFERDVANAAHSAIADGEALNIKFEEKRGRVNATHIVS